MWINRTKKEKKFNKKQENHNVDKLCCNLSINNETCAKVERLKELQKYEKEHSLFFLCEKDNINDTLKSKIDNFISNCRLSSGNLFSNNFKNNFRNNDEENMLRFIIRLGTFTENANGIDGLITILMDYRDDIRQFEKQRLEYKNAINEIKQIKEELGIN